MKAASFQRLPFFVLNFSCVEMLLGPRFIITTVLSPVRVEASCSELHFLLPWGMIPAEEKEGSLL